MVVCAVCRKNKAEQTHHLNYNPEITIEVCQSCHGKIHKNKFTGPKRGESINESAGWGITRQAYSVLESKYGQIITRGEVENICKQIGADANNVVRYLMRNKRLIRLFRGIFYVKTPNEVLTKKTDYNHLEMVARALEAKGVHNWYYGLHSALKLNNLTHEYFAVDEVINDKIFRARAMTIAGREFRFIKVKPSLLSFGVVGDELKYSDPEKTVLDFIYLWRYGGVPDEKIAMDVSDWARGLSSSRMRSYFKWYPDTVKRIAEEVMG